MSDESNAWVEVGAVMRAHGIRGELRVKLHNPDSEVLFEVDDVVVRARGVPDRVMQIVGARPAAGGIVLLALDGVDDRTQAEALHGATLHVQRDSLPQADDGEFYVHDILGAQVVTEDGTVYGQVVDYLTYPTADVLVVQGDRRFEVPLIEDFILRVDVPARRITVAPIDEFETT